MINCGDESTEFEYVVGSHKDAALQRKIESGVTYYETEAQPLAVAFAALYLFNEFRSRGRLR